MTLETRKVKKGKKQKQKIKTDIENMHQYKKNPQE